jgi:RNA-directed DNA polymerase
MPKEATPNGDAPLAVDDAGDVPVGPRRRVSEMQAKLHRWAVADPGRRFDDLFNLVHDPATLIVAWDRVATNRGANTAGSDGWTVTRIEADVGVAVLLDDLRERIKSGQFRPEPVREPKIPKPGGSGKVRRLGIPTVSDRVRPGGVEAGAGTDLRGRLRAGLLRVPARAARTRRDRRDPPVRHQGLPLGAGRGHRGVL